MSYIYSVCEEIQEVLDNQYDCVRDIKLKCSNKKYKNQFIPAIIIHPSALIVFVRFENCQSTHNKELVLRFRNVLNSLSEKLDVSINSFFMCGYSEANNQADISDMLCTFNIYNDRIDFFTYDDQLTDFVSQVVNEMEYRHSVFDNELLSELVFNLTLITGTNGEIRKNKDGNYYIRKHGIWFLASEHDSDALFRKAVYFGAFGAHKFADQKKGIGLLYFLTCGLFGVGWFFDCLTMFFGIYRDGEGKYLLPISNRKKWFLKMLVGFGITLTYIFIYVFLFCFLGDLFANILEGSISSGNIVSLNPTDL